MNGQEDTELGLGYSQFSLHGRDRHSKVLAHKIEKRISHEKYNDCSPLPIAILLKCIIHILALKGHTRQKYKKNVRKRKLPDIVIDCENNYLFSSWLLRAASASISPRVVFSTLELIFFTAFAVLLVSAAAFSALASA